MGYRVMELGAAGDGKTNDAHVIQKTLTCAVSRAVV